MKSRLFYSLLIISFLVVGCRTYYQKNIKFNDYFQKGKFKEADAVLASDKKAYKRPTKLLWYLNRGSAQHLMGNYDSSNYYFEQAIVITENFEKEYGLKAFSLLYNPTITTYQGEGNELVMINFYKALNYLYLKKYDAALVECRRMQNGINKLSDKYNKKNVFNDDAFIHLFMGLLYEADKDINNAYIAYKNAVNVYESSYAKLFNLETPNQLKYDIIRVAYQNGFTDEGEYYEKKFNIKNKVIPNKTGQVIFFYLNGLSPIKREWSINFTVERDKYGNAYFINNEYGWRYPYTLSDAEKNDPAHLSVSLVRMALPQYQMRVPVYKESFFVIDGKNYPFELVEDVSKVAFQSLRDRLTRDMGEALLRLATKQVVAYKIRKENETAGSVTSLINAITEQADTRSWQVLPSTISYQRLVLPTGKNTIQLVEKSNNSNVKNTTFDINVFENKTLFLNYHNLSSY